MSCFVCVCVERVTRLVMCHQNKAGCAGDEAGRTPDAGGAEGAARATTTTTTTTAASTTGQAGVYSFFCWFFLLLFFFTIDDFLFVRVCMHCCLGQLASDHVPIGSGGQGRGELPLFVYTSVFGHISFAGIASPVVPASGGQGGGRVGGQGGGGGAQVGGRGKGGQDDGKMMAKTMMMMGKMMARRW